MKDEELFDQLYRAKPTIDMLAWIVLAIAIGAGFSIAALIVVTLKQAFALHILPEIVARTLVFVS